ncbi:putative e3 ubiquitin-protein ligase hectd1 [Paratrimastix pyriformis]|uniref:E3 ubiquitin-protein ligase hectd1 n=1 Tax=Paratrimastix pyriformis TaxID=342808 RepID=A0ABQ8U911_9EUKA|nr:putative e3 ubiquitin-protein ligase hectd1 [Paratrimastix pyriformis]
MEGGKSNDTTPCCEKKRSPCRPRKQLDYVTTMAGDDENWRCPACLAHYEDPVCLSCGDTVCRTCVALIDGRHVKQMKCHCPHRGLGCEAVVGVLDVEHHLGAECEWREEECDQCHQQVRRAEMARHKDTTCARKPRLKELAKSLGISFSPTKSANLPQISERLAILHASPAMVVILLRVASWIDLTGRGFVPPTQVVTLASAPSLTAPEAPTANPPPEKPSGPGGMEGARDADDSGSNPGIGADFSSPSDEGKEPSADGSPGHLLQDSGAQETPLGLSLSLSSDAGSAPISQIGNRRPPAAGASAWCAGGPPRPDPSQWLWACMAAVETRKPKELDRKVSTLQKVVIQGLRAKRQSMTVKQLLTAAAPLRGPLSRLARLRAPPKESLPTKPGHLPGGVYNSDSRSCAYAAMIHALAAVRMAAPGATETLLAGSEALDHIGRAVAQAMDPHALPVDPQPMMAAMVRSTVLSCPVRPGAFADASELLLATLEASPRRDLWGSEARGASLCSRCGHATSWESPGPFIPVEALDTAFSSKCLCGGKRHDICALHAAPLIAVSTDGVLAGSARQALHAAAVSIGGIRYRLVACLSHQGSPRSGHEVAIIPSSTPDTYHVLSGTERTVVDENEAAVGSGSCSSLQTTLLRLQQHSATPDGPRPPAQAPTPWRHPPPTPPKPALSAPTSPAQGAPAPTIPAVGLVVKALAQAAPKATTAPTAQTTPAAQPAPSAINPSLAGAGAPPARKPRFEVFFPRGPPPPPGAEQTPGHRCWLRFDTRDAAEGAISAATGRYPAVWSNRTAAALGLSKPQAPFPVPAGPTPSRPPVPAGPTPSRPPPNKTAAPAPPRAARGPEPLLELYFPRGLPECMAAKPTTVRQSGLGRSAWATFASRRDLDIVLSTSTSRVAWSKAAVAQNRLPGRGHPRAATAPGTPTTAMAGPRRRIRAPVPPGAPLLPSPRSLAAPGIPLAVPGFPLAAPGIPMAAPFPQAVPSRPSRPRRPATQPALPHRRSLFPWLPDLMRWWPVLSSPADLRVAARCLFLPQPLAGASPHPATPRSATPPTSATPAAELPASAPPGPPGTPTTSGATGGLDAHQDHWHAPVLYFLANRHRHLYIGSTTHLTRRFCQHNGWWAGGALQTSRGRPWRLVAACWGLSLERTRRLEDLLHRPNGDCHFRKPVTISAAVSALCTLLTPQLGHNVHLHLISPVRCGMATATVAVSVTRGPLLHSFPDSPLAAPASQPPSPPPGEADEPPDPPRRARGSEPRSPQPLSEAEQDALRGAAGLADPEAILATLVSALARRTPARTAPPPKRAKPQVAPGPLRVALRRTHRIAALLRAQGLSMGCGYADVGCPTRCAQEDLAAHERDGVVAHMGLLRQRLADTSADLTQCKADLSQCKADLTQCKADLAQTQHDLAESRAAQSDTAAALSQTQHDLAAVRSQIDQPVPGMTAGAAPVGDPAAAACCTLAAAAAAPPPPAGPPVRYRVQATLSSSGSPVVVFTGPECRCRYRLPDDEDEARFAVVAMRGLAESGPSAPATCTRPGPSPLSSATTTNERGLFYYIGTQGRTQPWQNPAEAGWVTATRSSVSSAGEAYDLTGRQPCDSYTSSQPNSWWQVDLGAGRLFTPTRYTLRHSNLPHQVPYRLQSWRLEGSVDGADGSWRALDEHTNEPNAIPARADAMATFAVAPERAAPPPPPPAPAPAQVLVFTYDHDMDERGLFYDIGTQGRTQPWRNPAEAGWVTATRSSDESGKASDLTGRQPSNSYTGNQPNSWWQVDLGAERLFRPTRYTLRHSNYPTHVVHRLQSWRLEGSVDGGGDGSWRTLDVHTNEPNALAARADAMATFAVAPERAFPARRFRVLMTGPNPFGSHHLMLSGLEMYGSLSDPQQ